MLPASWRFRKLPDDCDSVVCIESDCSSLIEPNGRESSGQRTRQASITDNIASLNLPLCRPEAKPLSDASARILIAFHHFGNWFRAPSFLGLIRP